MLEDGKYPYKRRPHEQKIHPYNLTRQNKSKRGKRSESESIAMEQF